VTKVEPVTPAESADPTRVGRSRRRKIASLGVLVAALGTIGTLYAGLAPAASSASNSDPAIQAGRQLFLQGCSTCHGLNAEGGARAPSLIGVGAAAVDFQVGTGRMPMARPGTQAAARKVLYSPDEIKALAAFVASLGPGPSIPTKSQYDYSGLNSTEVARGGQFWRTNCTACHNFAAAGGALPDGRYAPSLSGVDPKHIYEAMITGPQQMPVFADSVVKPSEKREIIAYVKSLQSAPNYGGNALGSMGPVTEGMAAWIVGIGACVAFAVWIASHSVRSKKGAKA
jgi:ubiquinol-cytochrome c reductase cytochrome c subunit